MSTFERKPISKRMRFEMFKRDGFACRYCGRKGPGVVLEVDHVMPVSKGGSDDFDNLVTSCRDCNRGKSGVPIPAPRRIDPDVEKVLRVWKSHRPIPPFPGPEYLRLIIDEFSFEEVVEWVESAAAYMDCRDAMLPYFKGIIRNQRMYTAERMKGAYTNASN